VKRTLKTSEKKINNSMNISDFILFKYTFLWFKIYLAYNLIKLGIGEFGFATIAVG
jgi:hypothetical protein